MTCRAVIGAGRMGSAAARRLAGLGFQVVLWNRTRGRAEALAEEIGGDVVGTPAEAAARCSVVHVFVSDDRALMDVLFAEDGVMWAGRGVVVLNHSTVSVEASLLADEWLERRGQVYVEAPVIGGPPAAERGELLVLCAGRGEDGCGYAEPLGEVVPLGEPPRAMAAKLAFNAALLGFIASLGEAFMLAEAYGLGMDELADKVLSKTWMHPVLERYRPRMKPGGEARFRAALAGKDAAYASEALRLKGLPGLIAKAVEAYYSEMTGDGLGDSDYPSLAGYLAERARRAREKRGDGADTGKTPRG